MGKTRPTARKWTARIKRKLEVWFRKRKATAGGLTRANLKKNKRGCIVSRKKSQLGKKNEWAKTLKPARTKLRISGFQEIGGSTPAGVQLYEEMSSRYKKKSRAFVPLQRQVDKQDALKSLDKLEAVMDRRKLALQNELRKLDIKEVVCDIQKKAVEGLFDKHCSKGSGRAGQVLEFGLTKIRGGGLDMTQAFKNNLDLAAKLIHLAKTEKQFNFNHFTVSRDLVTTRLQVDKKAAVKGKAFGFVFGGYGGDGHTLVHATGSGSKRHVVPEGSPTVEFDGKTYEAGRLKAFDQVFQTKSKWYTYDAAGPHLTPARPSNSQSGHRYCVVFSEKKVDEQTNWKLMKLGFRI